LTSVDPRTVQAQPPPPPLSSHAASEEEEEEEEEDEDEDEEEDIPYSVLNPPRRKPAFPPLPDLRFEQSYLASIRGASNWKQVGYITVRDQVRVFFFPP
jgi:hypothetical protein